MMAKMFYTMDETKTALGRNEEDIKQLTREGRLREFRDGPRLMFKADQVDQLKAELGGGAATTPDLGSSDSGAALSMADSATGGPSGTGVISLADTDFGKSPGAAMMKEDTALAADLGLSGSVSGIPSPGRAGGTGSGLSSGSSAGSRGGITVFDVDDAHKADPSAQTAIGSGIQDQVQLESVGSGSGLLDLTRESDDTSLGAELLDEIAPTGGGRAARSTVVSDTGLGMEGLEAPRGQASRGGFGTPTLVEAHDPMALAFGTLCLGGTLVVLFAGFILANAVFRVHPEFVGTLSGKLAENKGIIYFLGAVVGLVVLFMVGWLFGKSTPARR
jgi:hypothetical protein